MVSLVFFLFVVWASIRLPFHLISTKLGSIITTWWIFATILICLLTYLRKKWLVSIGIEILRTIKYQQVVSYLRMVASITES